FVEQPGLSALEIASVTVRLIELCEMPLGDFDFGIDLSQPNWTGRVGVCLGKHLEEQGDRHLLRDTFQLLCLHVQLAIPDVSPQQFRIERQKAYIDWPDRVPQTFAALELGTQAVDPPWEKPGRPRLE